MTIDVGGADRLRCRVLRCVPLTSLCALLLVSVEGLAQDESVRAAARDLAQQGVTAYQAGDAKTASDRLDRAYRVMPVPSIALWSARALAKEGRLVSASERYGEALRWKGAGADAAVQEQAQREAAIEREQLQSRIPTLTVRVEGTTENVEVKVDGHTLPDALVGTAVPVDPGRRVVQASAGGRVVEQTIDVVEQAHAAAVLTFEPPPGAASPGAGAVLTTHDEAAPPPPTPPPPSHVEPQVDSGGLSQQTVGLAVGGLGVISLGVGGFFLSRALGKKSDSEAFCDGNVCRQKGVDLRDEARSAGNVATVGGLVGVAALGAGAFLFFTAGETDSGGPVQVGLDAGEGGAFLSARRAF